MSSRYGYASGNNSDNSYGSSWGSYGYGGGRGVNEADQQPREPGARRKKFAAFAGSVYRAGAAAATELKEQYNNTRLRNLEPWDVNQYSIPGSFPNVRIITKGNEQMVLFPTYAKRHIKGVGRYPPGHVIPAVQTTRDQDGATAQQTEEQFWKSEWDRAEDEKAIVDVDIRGWIYMPSKGPMTKRNRMVIGLARRLSGIPPPTVNQNSPGAGTSAVEERERMKEEERIAKEAKEIEMRGKGEEEVANRGGYSESPGRETGFGVSRTNTNHGPTTPPSPPPPPGRTNTGALPADLTEAELAVANANLMARIGPFMTTPMVEHPISLFFYNDVQSRRVTITTDDSGHFSTRAFLDFVPTHVRILADENLSVIDQIEIIESRGVSLISDVDDTIKRSSIGMGAREIFRNTFIRDLSDLTVPGVTEWYSSMHHLGVKMHYCSNSPWQLYPVLATFFHAAGLPQGSIHLKHYSGMLQGIFEPVAERKKGTLEAILRDFPERKFILVGDSGEADLEVYTELAVQNPGRILAVFIRDVTTPEKPGFFDSSFTAGGTDQRSRQAAPPPPPSRPKTMESRPQLPPRSSDAPSSTRSAGPIMGSLIDLSDEPGHISPGQNQSPTPSSDPFPRKTAPPPRPAKPAALRSVTSDGSNRPPPLAGNPRVHAVSDVSNVRSSPSPPPPPPPRRRGTPLANSSNMDLPELGSLSVSPTSGYQGSSSPASSINNTGNGNGGGNTTTAPAPTAAQVAINKKVDLWLRRLTRAHEVLDGMGVQLYTWRNGKDVIREAEGIVKAELKRQG